MLTSASNKHECCFQLLVGGLALLHRVCSPCTSPRARPYATSPNPAVRVQSLLADISGLATPRQLDFSGQEVSAAPQEHTTLNQVA